MLAPEIVIHPNRPAQISSPWGFPLREDVAFTDALGDERPDLARKEKVALELLQPLLQKILEPGEAVLYFTRAQVRPDLPERYMLGVVYRRLARAALIFTNRRLLYVTLKWDGAWNRNLRSARWGDVKSFRISGRFSSTLQIEYRQGASESYWRIPLAAGKKIQIILDALLPASEGDTSAALGMVSFCPQCFSALTPKVYECPNCRMKFKDEIGALLHGLLVPGGGYFYADLNLLGILHAFVDVTILFTAIMWALAAVGRIHPQPPHGAVPGKETFTVLAVFFFGFLVLDVWLSIRVARKAVRYFIPVPW